jgi:hypothetical protein
MRYYTRKVPILAVALLVALSAPAQPGARETESKLDAKVNQFSLSGNGLADALAKIAEQFEIPMGVEWVKDKQTVRPLSLAWRASTLRGVLNAVVGSYPGYSWQVQDGLVHVFRRDLVSDSGNFLNLKVPNWFEAHDRVGGMISQDLQLALQNIVSPRKLPLGAGVGGSYGTSLQEKPLTLDLGGLTVREALDKLIDASEHKIWVVTFSETPDRTPTGFRRTETLWHPKPFPDRNQPMWDFLTWPEFVRTSTPGM